MNGYGAAERARAVPGAGAGALLSVVPPEDRASVRATADRLVERWPSSVHDGQQYDPRVVAVTVAAMAPALSDDKLSVLYRYCLWTVRLDARLDARGVRMTQAQHIARRVAAIVAGQPPLAGPFETELAEILAGLRGANVADQVFVAFADALLDAVAAGVEQAELNEQAGSPAPPSAEQYLDLAARDVNYRSVALGLLLLVGVSAAEQVRLDEAIWHACRAVRLANDLATVAKDLRDRRLNVLALRMGNGAPVTTADVERWIEQHLHQHTELLADAAATGRREPSQALANSLRMALSLYRLAGRGQGGRHDVARHP